MMIVALMYGMIPKAPTAQRSSAPPVNMLHMVRTPPAPESLAACFSKYSDSAAPFKPGIGIIAVTRQMPSTRSVNRILDLSSGILKQFANVLAMAAIILPIGASTRPDRGGWLRADHFARAAFGLNFCPGRRAEGMRAEVQLFRQLAVAQNLDALPAAVRQASPLQRFDIDARALVEPVQRLQIHRRVARGVTRIVETAFGEAADERHLTAFETDADRAAGAGRLPLAAATGGFAVAAGFALAEPFAAMLGARTRSQIMQTHKKVRPAPPAFRLVWPASLLPGRDCGRCRPASGVAAGRPTWLS